MKTIVITGANRGIGLAMARRAAESGAQVIATARKLQTADNLRALADESDRVAIHALDVTDEASIAAFAAALDDAIDLLVQNAGVLNTYGGIDDPAHDAEAWRSVLMTNVAGPFLVTRALLPKLAESAKIAIISSNMGSSRSAPGNAYAYRASKAAACNLALNLAAELRPRGIAVGAYHPGWVRTEMGGGGADIAVEESAAGLLRRFAALGLATSGVFEDYRGEALAF